MHTSQAIPSRWRQRRTAGRHSPYFLVAINRACLRASQDAARQASIKGLDALHSSRHGRRSINTIDGLCMPWPLHALHQFCGFFSPHFLSGPLSMSQYHTSMGPTHIGAQGSIPQHTQDPDTRTQTIPHQTPSVCSSAERERAGQQQATKGLPQTSL